jgi:pyruvate/2-oxoglutarate dehydrogenase complex dihydrolipoamide dehydrogenase (E3) component
MERMHSLIAHLIQINRRAMNRKFLLSHSTLYLASHLTAAFLQPLNLFARSYSKTCLHAMDASSQGPQAWLTSDPAHILDARKRLHVWPLDEENAKLLDEVHPKSWPNVDKDTVYDLIAIGAGAGGLVSSRQTARRGGKSAMISAQLAGGDCLNIGCVPSKALIRSARMIREVRKAQSLPEFGVTVGGSVEVDFGAIMQRMRKLRAEIAPVDGHERGQDIGVDVFQGFGRFVDENTIEVVPPASSGQDPVQLKFKKVAICTGGRATIPSNIPGLEKSPYTTNETLFNLVKLPQHMVILGSGVVALEMAQVFATFGSKVTVLVRSDTLFPRSDPDVGPCLQKSLEESSNVEFVKLAKLTNVETLKEADANGEELPLMKLTIEADGESMEVESDCLLVAAGRSPNVEGLNLEAANVEYDAKKGILVDDLSKSISNPNVYSVGDCTADVPRLTHMAGEMAKVVVNNALFDDDWKLSSLVVPSCMYTEPEFASVGDVSGDSDLVDIYTASMEHIDRAILDGDREGYVKIFCKKGTGVIVGCVIIAGRAGELINEVTLAMKHNIPLDGIGRNIHCYPTTGDAVMGCGLQIVNSKWKKFE